MSARPALFPPPEPEPPGMSTALGAEPALRLRPGERAKWTRLSARRIDCVECGLLQHEKAGAFGPRRAAKRRRAVAGTRLDLCHAHAQAWHDRDEHDSALPEGMS